ncbi:hypothetical protein F8E02_12415 [Methanoculleus sp. Wushi-C6]|uniref:Neurotransmitter-gated ion-channel ligand-binding domain-containing protein n=1 Tax=Methanoculleus caldifontis TaxID=2651577 RepID=A0ABU3X5S8_9EURY|nr:hypothetical protein [Methanoculleus sp. Wushi-C6]MDV2482781.1 hypothetical protein [Methanoculleus sp. Wushi-C6]
MYDGAGWPVRGRGDRSVRAHTVWRVLFLALLLGALAGTVAARDDAAVQELTGRIEPGQAIVYDLDLQAGQTLYAYAEGTSGNLDPFLAVAGPDLNASRVHTEFANDVNRSLAAGQDALGVIPEVAGRYFLAWNDDTNGTYDSALQYRAPAAGGYRLIVIGSPARRGQTFGDYRLLVGIDAPQVLTGQAEPTGAAVAVLNTSASRMRVGVREVTGNLSANRSSTFYILDPVEANDTFYASIEAASGNLVPAMILRDYGGKPLAAVASTTETTGATLQYTFSGASSNNRLEVLSSPLNGVNTTGDFRLLTGLNAPGVLAGNEPPGGRPVLQEPIQVKVGVELEQITDVDQVSENFAAVANIWMEWNDPALAFSPDECNCRVKIYRSIGDFVDAEGSRWPEFTLYNQQAQRWTQNQIIVVQQSGTATYFEHFWTTLQAPDFNFRAYPFDTQDFFIRIDSLYPEELYVYEPWPEKTAVGTQLGEEEWYITASDTGISTVEITTRNSRYSFHFEAARHLTYYILRILVPILIIILLTYVTFLLKDYGKRAEIASANLLLFIAFNFTIAGSLPRLGYLTFLDAVLVATFVITGATVAYNLYLRWLATERQKEIAERIDRLMVWLYPAAYVAAFVLASLFF